ncbi:MAG TPA: PAS domain S-box protein [Candidatus Solibacter sp.]|jgi:PAS domain S-box-containing protein|nr:PAS domain S-box protein [Candidatus Solibacter sp.]
MSTITRQSSTIALDGGARWDEHRSRGHSVQFYEDDAFLLDGLSRFIGAALLAGDSAIVIATESHREGLTQRLTSRGLDLMPSVKQGRYLSLDAAETLAKFMVNGWPDQVKFSNVIGSVITQLSATAQAEHPRVAVFGEMVTLLWAEGKSDAAVRLEQLWNDLAQTHSFQLHCAYPMNFFSQEKDGGLVQKICSEHSHVAPTESYTTLGSDEERRRSIIFLQQKAQALETEKKKAEEASLQLAAIVQSADDAIVSKDLNGVVTSWNRAAERIFGYRAEEIVGRSILLIIPPELQHQEPSILAKIRAGERIEHFETVRLRKDGERLNVSLTISPVKDHRGKIIGVAKIVRNITQQKKLEEALHTSEKLAAVGRLAATVAHEINNPLEAVTNFIYLAKQQPELPDRLKNYLERADRELGRVSHIAQQTLGFYRDSSQPVELVVANAVEVVLIVYESRFKYKALKIEKRIQPDLTIWTLQGELKQILSNLIANAIDASREGGKIVICARASRHFQSGRAGIRITVADDGAGISPESKQKLFTPFFTTKKEVGTGLGLWITKDLLEKKGGHIRFRSQTGRKSGTVMSLFIPVQLPAASAEQAA